MDIKNIKINWNKKTQIITGVVLGGILALSIGLGVGLSTGSDEPAKFTLPEINLVEDSPANYEKNLEKINNDFLKGSQGPVYLLNDIYKKYKDGEITDSEMLDQVSEKLVTLMTDLKPIFEKLLKKATELNKLPENNWVDVEEGIQTLSYVLEPKFYEALLNTVNRENIGKLLGDSDSTRLDSNLSALRISYARARGRMAGIVETEGKILERYNRILTFVDEDHLKTMPGTQKLFTGTRFDIQKYMNGGLTTAEYRWTDAQVEGASELREKGLIAMYNDLNTRKKYDFLYFYSKIYFREKNAYDEIITSVLKLKTFRDEYDSATRSRSIPKPAGPLNNAKIALEALEKANKQTSTEYTKIKEAYDWFAGTTEYGRVNQENVLNSYQSKASFDAAKAKAEELKEAILNTATEVKRVAGLFYKSVQPLTDTATLKAKTFRIQKLVPIYQVYCLEQTTKDEAAAQTALNAAITGYTLTPSTFITLSAGVSCWRLAKTPTTPTTPST